MIEIQLPIQIDEDDPERLQAEDLGNGRVELKEHSCFVPFAPGDILTVDADLVVTGVEKLVPLYSYEVFFHLPADIQQMARPADDHPAMTAVDALQQEWANQAWVTRTTNFSMAVSSQTLPWLEEHVLHHPYVQFKDLIRTPEFRMNYEFAVANPNDDGNWARRWA